MPNTRPAGLPPGVAYDESLELTGLYGLMLKLYAAALLLAILTKPV